ncbi:unnamed protein product [Moneuplotes crassus]|uniref:Uncharacterized protein n=1 Tax=Euplotes crassus TaxID=5936 RepID=A0AAD1XCG3_EUPCR|nr:unnamed protein product [Moneuplotes crassus]
MVPLKTTTTFQKIRVRKFKEGARERQNSCSQNRFDFNGSQTARGEYSHSSLKTIFKNKSIISRPIMCNFSSALSKIDLKGKSNKGTSRNKPCEFKFPGSPPKRNQSGRPVNFLELKFNKIVKASTKKRKKVRCASSTHAQTKKQYKHFRKSTSRKKKKFETITLGSLLTGVQTTRTKPQNYQKSFISQVRSSMDVKEVIRLPSRRIRISKFKHSHPPKCNQFCPNISKPPSSVSKRLKIQISNNLIQTQAFPK